MTYYELAERSAQIANADLGTGNIDPRWIYAQWQHESANFTSPMARENNNFGGLTQVEPNGEENRMTNSPLYAKLFNSPEEYAEYFGHYIAKYAEDGIGSAKNIDEYLTALKHGGYFTEDDDAGGTYFNGVHHWAEGDIADLAVQHVGPWGMTQPLALPQLPNHPAVNSFWDEFTDKFNNQFLDQGVVSGIRTAYYNVINMDSMAELALNNYQPSQEDIELVRKSLEGDTVAQNYVLSNSHNRATLLSLLAMKQEDRARAERVANMDYGLSTVGSILGSIADPTLLIALVPFANLGAVANVATKIGKVRAAVALAGKVLDSSKVARMAVRSMSAMAYAGLDRFGAERWGGWQPDYATSMTFAGMLGAFGESLRKLPKNDIVDAVNHINDNARNNAVGIAIGGPTSLDAKNNIKNELLSEMLDGFAQEGTDIDLHYKPTPAPTPKVDMGPPAIAAEGTDIPVGITKSVPTEKVDSQAFTGNTSGLPSVERPGLGIEGTGKPLSSSEENLIRATRWYYDLVPEGSLPDKLVKDGVLFILPQKQATKWAAKYFVNLDKDAKAFSIPKMGVSILIKEKVTRENLMGLVAHEVGVHLALQKVIGMEAYNKLLLLAKRRMQSSKDPKWIAATRKATNPEEALAYYVEQIDWTHPPRGLNFVKKAIRRFMSPTAADDAKIEKFVQKALEEYQQTVNHGNVANLVKLTTKISRSNKWKEAIAATKGKPLTEAITYWLKHDPDTKSVLYKELHRQAKAALNKKRVTQQEVIDWAVRYLTHGDSIFYKVVNKMGLHSGDNLMTVKAFGDDYVFPTAHPDPFTSLDNAEVDLGRVINRNAAETISQSSPVQTLEDGSHIINDVVYSPKNVIGNAIAEEVEDLGEIHYSKGDVHATIFDDFSDKGAGSKARQGRFGKFGLWMEHSKFTGNIFGILRNSHSRKAQQFAQTLFLDPRMESSNMDFLPAESIKQFLTDRWMSKFISFVDLRSQYITDTFGFLGKTQQNNLIKQVDEQAIKCYNAKAKGNLLEYDKYSPEIKQLAQSLQELNDDIWMQLKKNSEQFGGRKGLGSLIDFGEPTAADEFYRITDDLKWTEWAGRNFDNQEELEETLAEYARRFMDREAETKYWIDLKRYEFEKKKKAWNGEGDPPKWKEPTAEEIEEHLEQAAKNWAHGRVDKNASKLSFNEVHTSQMTNTLKHRLPMDTSGVMVLKNGTQFSFDKDLRNYDIDTYLPQIINRLSGEVALRATIGDDVAQKKFYDSIVQELTKNSGVINGGREREAMDMGLHRMLGIGSYNLYDQKVGDCFSNSLRTLSYANVGGNMTAAQLGEYGGAIAMGGFKVLTDSIPIIKNIAQHFRNGPKGQELIEDTARKLYADDIATRAFGVTYSTDSRCYREILDKISEENPVPTIIGRGADATNRLIKRAALMTSAVNFMPKLTNLMVQTMRKSMVEDSLKWALGKEFKGTFSFRDPFSAKKLAAAGIHNQKQIDAIKDGIKKYLIDGKGDIDAWWDADPLNFMKWKRLVDQQAMRGIQQNSIGNMTPFKENHKLFFQFKDFTMKAMNQQFMRALSSHERDDMMSALYSYATNTMTYTGLTYARAYAYYPNDEKKRQEYLNRNASFAKIAGAGFFRMSMLAPTSFAADAWEAATGQSMYRTTVDNSNYRRRADESWDQRITTMANQTPAIGYAGRLYQAMQGASNLSTGQGTTKDIDNVIRAMPLGQWVAMTYAGSLVKQESGLPKKRREKAPVYNKLKVNSNSRGKQDIVSKITG